MAMALLAGCGAKEEAAVQEQVLTVAIGTDVENWDISKFPDGDARFVWSQVYETLVRLDPDLKLVPGLAEKWESQEAGKVWLFHLRKGVKFHDGTLFNAAAVVYSYSERSNVIKAGTLPVTKVEAVDDYTVKFTCQQPVPLDTYLTHVAWPVAGPGSIDSAGNFVNPVGTGPFKLVKQTKSQEIVLERNADYWGEKPQLDRVVFKVIPDASTRTLALTAGDVDMCIKVPEPEIRQLEQDPKITVHRKLSTFTDFLQFNTKKGPFTDVKLRQAVAYSIDTAGMVKNMLDGIGAAARGRAYSPVMLYSTDNLPLYQPDPEKAKALLAAAGWQDTNGDGVVEKNGQPLKVKMLVSSWSSRQQREAEACQAQLAAAGFAAGIALLETGALTRAENQGDFDVILRSGFFVWGPYPHHVRIHHSKNYRSHYQNPAYDQVVDAAETTTDEQQKRQLYEQVQKMILAEVPAFYLVHEEKVVATRNNVAGYTITAEDPWLNLAGVHLKR
ncbi:MAG: ABC transporter substrate-binding protein [Heliobacteriaceae bacterium]|nr:ABC transporter substrate-binding protein [Heliobacteriaceae bacterium]